MLADPKKSASFGEGELLEYLVAGLPDEFDITCQTLDAQPNLETYQKVNILRIAQETFDSRPISKRRKTDSAKVAQLSQLTLDEAANVAKWNPSAWTGCYFCGNLEHSISQCELKAYLIKHVEEFRVPKDKESRGRGKPAPRKQSKPRTSVPGQRLQRKRSTNRNRVHGRAANDNSNSDTSSEMDSEDEDVDETCHISKSKSCKIPESSWCGDTGCTAHMTDQLDLFRGPLIKIKRRTIRVGGGKLYADEMGTAEMKVGGVSLLLNNALYVPGLGMNLLSSRKICSERKCVGVFNEDSMWFISEDSNAIIQADVKGGLYFVSKIMPLDKGMQEMALLCTPGSWKENWTARREPDPGQGLESRELASNPLTETVSVKAKPERELSSRSGPIHQSERPPSQLSSFHATAEEYSFDLDDEPCCHVALTAGEAMQLDENEDLEGVREGKTMKRLSRRERVDYYNLMHRRFGHMGPDQLRNLHKVTKLKRPIVIPLEREICRVCKLTKLRNRTNHKLSPWKESILALVSIDVAGPFLPSMRGNKWFCQIVDNSTRRT